MKFNLIDMNSWERKECFEHFFNNAKCTYSITINVEITKFYNYVKNNKYRIYPAFTWMVSRAINNHKEFKMAFDEQGRLGFFDEIGPSYSVLNPKTKIMNNLYNSFNENFSEFYNEMDKSLKCYERDTNFTTNFQMNFFIASCLPWFDYTSFNVNNEGDNSMLFPIVTWGKFNEENNKVTMPLTIQVHHAVADGYHCSLFFSDIKEILLKPEKYLV